MNLTARSTRFLSRFHLRSYSIASSLRQDTAESIIAPDHVFSGYYNTGTSLPLNVRQRLSIRGQSPAVVETTEQQAERALRAIRSKSARLDKYMFMAQLRQNHTRLFYKLVTDHIEEFAPIIYTPTVGEACQRFSDLYPFIHTPGTPDGLYITLDDLSHLEEIMIDYKKRSGEAPDISVITDGSRILGLGDLGVNGMPISLGKLQLYVAGAGIDPRKTLPIVLDFGTNNTSLLNDPLYLGKRTQRPDDATFYAAVEQVLDALCRTFPEILVQFEDFSSDHAFGLLERHRQRRLCFNDDIQGTGAVILSGLINAFRQTSTQDHRILFYGAGSAAIGVARQIQDYFQTVHGMTEEEAKKLFYVCDSKGLVTADRPDLAPHKVYYARQDYRSIRSIDEIINTIRPTALIGLSSSPGAFTPQVLSRMGQINDKPIIFPLSNPATKAECTFEDAMKATDKVLFASGTAFPPYEGRVPGQGNNMYIFPGLGLGAILSRPTYITDRIMLRASVALADSLTEKERNQGHLYPDLHRIREVSATVAAAVCDQAVKDNVATHPRLKSIKDYLGYVKANMWHY
ncbi:Putative Malic enzyme [Rhizopus microsporus]|nr:Putative Malic enzyme [Rhizopus microsporus]